MTWACAPAAAARPQVRAGRGYLLPPPPWGRHRSPLSPAEGKRGARPSLPAVAVITRAQRRRLQEAPRDGEADCPFAASPIASPTLFPLATLDEWPDTRLCQQDHRGIDLGWVGDASMVGEARDGRASRPQGQEVGEERRCRGRRQPLCINLVLVRGVHRLEAQKLLDEGRLQAHGVGQVCGTHPL